MPSLHQICLQSLGMSRVIDPSVTSYELGSYTSAPLETADLQGTTRWTEARSDEIADDDRKMGPSSGSECKSLIVLRLSTGDQHIYPSFLSEKGDGMLFLDRN